MAVLDVTLTRPKRALGNWLHKLEERDDFITSTPYNTETFEMLDKLLAATDKMWKQYFSILEEVEKEDSSSSFGGAQDSLLESKLSK